MKIKKKSEWRDRQTGEAIRVSRLRKNEICYYPISGGGAEQKLKRDAFLARYEPVNANV